MNKKEMIFIVVLLLFAIVFIIIQDIKIINKAIYINKVIDSNKLIKAKIILYNKESLKIKYKYNKREYIKKYDLTRKDKKYYSKKNTVLIVILNSNPNKVLIDPYRSYNKYIYMLILSFILLVIFIISFVGTLSKLFYL